MGMTRREFVEVCAAALGIAIVGECKLFDFAYQCGVEDATESEDDEDEEPPSPSPAEQ